MKKEVIRHRAFGKEFLNADSNKIVRLLWNDQDKYWWNEVCAKVVDHFGLPGQKYTTEVSENELKFFFKDEREALLCKIMISETL